MATVNPPAYKTCVRCNKRHTHSRFQTKKPHSAPMDWEDVIGPYVNKHTGRPIAQRVQTDKSVFCYSCIKHYRHYKKRKMMMNTTPSVSKSEQHPVPSDVAAILLTFDN